MFKILILQKWYSLSDLAIERQMADRISFMAFLGYPELFPDSRTVWLFKQRIAETGKDKMVLSELQRQLDEIGLRVKHGTMQDATFIGFSMSSHVSSIHSPIFHRQAEENSSCSELSPKFWIFPVLVGSASPLH